MEQKKKKKEPDMTVIAYFTAGAVIVSLITLFGASAFLKLNTIVVEGYLRYTPEQVAAATGVEKGKNLLYLNKDNVAGKIKESLPYIESVEITKEFPDTLRIDIVESTPVAYLPHAGGALVIDSTGRVLEIINTITGTSVQAGGAGLIEIRGVPVSSAEEGKPPVIELGSETGYTTMRDILSVMEREGIAADVNYIDVASITNINFGYMNMYKVIIGGLSNFRAKIVNLPSYIAQVQDKYQNVSGTLNLTNPSGDWSLIPE